VSLALGAWPPCPKLGYLVNKLSKHHIWYWSNTKYNYAGDFFYYTTYILSLISSSRTSSVIAVAGIASGAGDSSIPSQQMIIQMDNHVNKLFIANFYGLTQRNSIIMLARILLIASPLYKKNTSNQLFYNSITPKTHSNFIRHVQLNLSLLFSFPGIRVI